jgi:hypothetical protein
MTFKERFNAAYGKAKRKVGKIWKLEASRDTIEKMKMWLNWIDKSDPSVLPPKDPTHEGWIGNISVFRNDDLGEDQVWFEGF